MWWEMTDQIFNTSRCLCANALYHVAQQISDLTCRLFLCNFAIQTHTHNIRFWSWLSLFKILDEYYVKHMPKYECRRLLPFSSLWGASDNCYSLGWLSIYLSNLVKIRCFIHCYKSHEKVIFILPKWLQKVSVFG